MKKFQNNNEVVLVMSQEEFIDLDLLVAAGVCYERDYEKFSDKELDRFRALRDNL